MTAGQRTVDQINDFGNVSVFYVDGLGRPIREERFLTASGQGDGVSIGASLEGIKNDPSALESFPPAVDPAQGGGDGIIRRGTTYDRNSLPSARFDDQGNITLSLYDNSNRHVAAVFGLTVNSPMHYASILGPRLIATPTPSTIDNPALIQVSKVSDQLAESTFQILARAGEFPSLADRVDPPTANIYGYDEDNNLLIFEDQNDTEAFRRFDAVDRAIAVRVFRSGQNNSHAGDPIFAPSPASDLFYHPGPPFPAIVGTTKQDTQYDGLSRATRATDNNEPLIGSDDSIVTSAFDSLSRVIEETQRIGPSAARAIDYAWRAENLNSKVTYPNGRAVEVIFDALDRARSAGDAGLPVKVAEHSWIGQDRILVTFYPGNGTRMTHLDPSGTIDVGFDGVRRPTLVHHLRSNNSLVVATDNQYDRVDNRILEFKLHDPINTEISRFDSAYRTVEFQRTGIPPQHSNWQIDGVGNWRQVDAEVRLHSSQNEIIQQDATPLESDGNGNLNNDRQLQFTFDFQNRLRTVTRQADGLVVSQNSYDALDRRAQHMVTNAGPLDGTTQFFYSFSHVIEERSGTRQLKQQYVVGPRGEILVLDRNLNGDNTAIGPGDQRLFYHSNVVGFTYALTNHVGQIVEGYMFDAHGRQFVFQPGPNGTVDFDADDFILPGGHSAVGNPYLYLGERLDANTGLVLIDGRHFHTELGRYLTHDYNVAGMSDASHQDAEDFLWRSKITGSGWVNGPAGELTWRSGTDWAGYDYVPDDETPVPRPPGRRRLPPVEIEIDPGDHSRELSDYEKALLGYDPVTDSYSPGKFTGPPKKDLMEDFMERTAEDLRKAIEESMQRELPDSYYRDLYAYNRRAVKELEAEKWRSMARDRWRELGKYTPDPYKLGEDALDAWADANKEHNESTYWGSKRPKPGGPMPGGPPRLGR